MVDVCVGTNAPIRECKNNGIWLLVIRKALPGWEEAKLHVKESSI